MRAERWALFFGCVHAQFHPARHRARRILVNRWSGFSHQQFRRTEGTQVAVLVNGHEAIAPLDAYAGHRSRYNVS